MSWCDGWTQAAHRLQFILRVQLPSGSTAMLTSARPGSASVAVIMIELSVAHLHVGERSPQPGQGSRTVGFACRLATRRAPHGGGLVAQVALQPPDLVAASRLRRVQRRRRAYAITPAARLVRSLPGGVFFHEGRIVNPGRRG